MAKKALIFGITGQDGAYLTALLLSKGYIVHGVKRRNSNLSSASRLDYLYADPIHEDTNLYLHYGDVTDYGNVMAIISETEPDEIYNLAAQSHVAVSFVTPIYTGNVDGLGTVGILEAIRTLGLQSAVRYYQASTSELFGKVTEVPQNEDTLFNPQSPYAAAKLYAFYMTKLYREAYAFHASNGILFNHESPLRGETFVTRKIIMALVRIKRGLQDRLSLGNLDSKRDWGHARDYVAAMWLMLQQNCPDDYVVATGVQCTVREFVNIVCEKLELKISWHGEGVDELAADPSGKVVVDIRPEYYRPAEVGNLLGDPRKIKDRLGWNATTTLDELIEEMISYDSALIEGRTPNPF